jgi:rhodanese-related sulfurtransferase
MPTTVKELLAAANSAVPKIRPEDAATLIEDGNILVVDVRDGLEVQSTGKIQGATHVTRGMLEFRADPESPYYDKSFRPKQDGAHLLCLRRTICTRGQNPSGFWL